MMSNTLALLVPFFYFILDIVGDGLGGFDTALEHSTKSSYLVDCYFVS